MIYKNFHPQKGPLSAVFIGLVSYETLSDSQHIFNEGKEIKASAPAVDCVWFVRTLLEALDKNSGIGRANVKL